MDYKLYTFWKHKTLDNFLFQLVGLRISKERGVFKFINTHDYDLKYANNYIIQNCHSGAARDYWYNEKGQNIYHTKENIVSYKFFDLNEMIQYDEFNTPFNTKSIDNMLNILTTYENNK